MEEKNIKTHLLGMRFYANWIDEFNLEELIDRVKEKGFKGIPRVAVCKIPKNIQKKLSKYEQTKELQYLILGDGLHRSRTALSLDIDLPCTIYFPKEEIDTEKHGERAIGIIKGNWYKKEIKNYMKFLEPYIKSWKKHHKIN